jgi:hypothetical protein
VLPPGGRLPTPELRSVDHVVVDEGGDVGELDRDAAAKRTLPLGRRQMDEDGAETLPT